jgi:hypothetical protein
MEERTYRQLKGAMSLGPDMKAEAAENRERQ